MSKILCNVLCFLILAFVNNQVSNAQGSNDPKPIDEHNVDQPQKMRVRRQYYVCPPGFKRISSNCYYFSKHMATWRNAHYDCRDRLSELAILQTPAEDKKLRGQLNKPSVTPLEWWIGGIYDWEQMKWKWGVSGRKLEYHGFSRMGPENKEKLKWHCIILDPTMRYKWSARSCVLGKHYICQKKVARVNTRGLEKLRKKYNSTLNEIPAPSYVRKPKKPRKHENLSNGNEERDPYSKNYPVIGDNNELSNAFGHRRNLTQTRRGRKRNKKRKNRRNRKNRPFELHVRNGTNFTAVSSENGFPFGYDADDRRRNRRNKSKESNSVEIKNDPFEEMRKKKKRVWELNNGLDDLQRTTESSNTISPLHPRVIVEEHDFLELKN